MNKKFINSGIYSKRMYYLKLTWLIFSRTPLVISIMLALTVTLVFGIEFFTKSDTREPIITIINNLSYNCLAGCIFYLFTLHVPQEIKKIKLHILVHNKTMNLTSQINNIFMTLIEYSHSCKTTVKLTRNEIDDLFKKLSKELQNILNSTNSFLKVDSQTESKVFNNWIEYWNWKSNKIKRCINELAPYNEFLSYQYLKYLTTIESKFFHMDYVIDVFKYNKNNKTLHLFQVTLDTLLFYSQKLGEQLHQDFGELSFRLHSYEFVKDMKEAGANPFLKS